MRFLAAALMLVHLSAAAQHENDRWVFGGMPFPTNPPALNFFSGTPVPVPTVPTSPFWSTEAAATAADKTTGALLFYTDAIKVFDANNNAMLNGGATFTTNIKGCTSATQGALVIPRPGAPKHYYLFTVDCSEDFTSPSYSGLSWSEVDMGLNGGLGDVIGATRNTLLWGPPLHGKVTERLTAARHSNGTDYWIVVHEWGNSSFLAFQVSCSGISTTPVISSVGAIHNSASSFPTEVIGTMKISPDGSRLALTAGYGTMNVIELFAFNTGTGVVSAPLTMTANGLDYGLEFSPNSTRLFVTRYNPTPCCSGTIFQYNLLAGGAAAIQASKVQIATSSTFGYGGLQLGPDNRIHVSRVLQTNNLGIISNPNNMGGSAGFSNTGAALSGRRSNIGLINLVRFQSGPDCMSNLPVELLSFTGGCEEGTALLEWTTASELNNDHFDVLRSRDGITWQTIGMVMGQGNSSTLAEYAYRDDETMSGTNYYTLRQVDGDGASDESSVIAITCLKEGCRVRVDAVAQLLWIDGLGDQPIEDVTLFNSLGQVVVTSLENSIAIDVLRPGAYVAMVRIGEGSVALRFVKG